MNLNNNDTFLSVLDDAFLGLGDTSHFNFPDILKNRPEDLEHWGLSSLRVISDPKYLWYACKVLLNVDLLPFQLAILQEMWSRPFPMFIGTRGCGKSFLMSVYCMLKLILTPPAKGGGAGCKVVVIGAAFRQSKVLFEYMETMWRNSPRLRSLCKGKDQGPKRDVDRCKMNIGENWCVCIPMGCLSPDSFITTNKGITTLDNLKNQDVGNFKVWSNNKFRNIGFFFNSGVSECIQVKTKRGYGYKGTPNHKMKIVRNNKIVWCRTDELKIGDRILIDRTIRWHKHDNKHVSVEDAYVFGLMVGDGCYTNKYKFRYTSLDKELHTAVRLLGDFRMNKDNLHADLCGKKLIADWLAKWEIKHASAKNKEMGSVILSCNKKKMRAFLQGLFDTDGSMSILTKNTEPSGHLSYTTISKKLAKQIHYVLSHFGIVSTLSSRLRKNKNAQRAYEIGIYGNDIQKFKDRIGFRLKRKQKILNQFLNQRQRKLSIKDTIPIDPYLVPSTICARRNNLTFDKAIKTNFQHELVNTDYFYDEVVTIAKQPDQLMYDINVPDGNEYGSNGFFSHNTGEKIRGLRATIVLADEFNSLSREIYETVVQGFASVTANPTEKVKLVAKDKQRKKLGLDKIQDDDYVQEISGNQIILSGTCGYEFEHFAEYWQTYKAIVESCGDPKKLEEIYPEGIPENFNWQDYCVIRIPFDLIPEGFMDTDIIMRAKATTHTGLFQMEYGAVFTKDSNGFFRSSCIQRCVAKEENIEKPDWPSWCPNIFDAVLRGASDKKYVIAIDPASEVDNFSIVVLELHDNHSRVVYCWTTNRKEHVKRRKAGLTNETDFYAYAARKIRELLSLFNCERIVIDAQGGGISVIEALHNKNNLLPNEVPIWPIIDENKEADTDNEPGLHIVEAVQFAKYEWLSDANHGMRKDLEDKVLLFPRFDPISLELAAAEDNRRKADFENNNSGQRLVLLDTLEDCILEIEELKRELTTIVITKTGTGVNSRDRWDTPEIKTEHGRKGRLRKDRYSALLMANMVARQMRVKRAGIQYDAVGGYIEEINENVDGSFYVNTPEWLQNGEHGSIDDFYKYL